MALRAFVYAYLLGGLTFIPILLAAVFAAAWYLLPQIEDGSKESAEDGVKKSVDDDPRERREQKKTEVSSSEGAEGTFAVLRQYDFPAAIAALHARNAAPGTIPAVDGSTEAGNGGSESVYQSMYRSVFDRGKHAAVQSSILDTEEDAVLAGNSVNGRVKKRDTTPANIFYIVLRHGHLMLYDSAAQKEVRRVISLAHHSISLTEGTRTSSGEGGTERLKDGDLFIKRTAIVLTPLDLPNGGLQRHSAPSKPFYLFSAISTEKETFYHALLSTLAPPPIAELLEAPDMIKLQSTLHSTSLTTETRALNALMSRLFLALYHTDRAKNFIQRKVEKKISRVQKPAFIASLAVQSVDLGDAAPTFSNFKLKDLNISGDTTISFDIRYTGGIRLTISALAKLDLGPRFKTRTADLVLASSLQRLQGHMLVRIKPPPSNRIWFCFDSAPEMEIKVEPVVSQRQITYTFILRAIEDRIRTVVNETLVKPNWDDLSFFDTREQHIRGGIWQAHGDELSNKKIAGGLLKERNERTKSMPALVPSPNGVQSTSATSSGSETTPKRASGNSLAAADRDNLKRRSASSLPPQSLSPPAGSVTDLTTETRLRSHASPPITPLRSPSLSSPSASSPSVALDESPANVEPSLSAPQAQKRWRGRNAAPSLPTRREAVDAMREMRDRSSAAHGRSSGEGGESDRPPVSGPTDGTSAATSDSPPAPSSLFATRAATLRSLPRRTDSSLSTSTTNSQQRKQNLLAATAAATSAARTWSWNALAAAKAKKAGQPGLALQEMQPMGRGQPLPPPGVPLPGPQKGLFGGLGGSVRRKPVPPLPARRPTVVEDNKGVSAQAKEVRDEDLNGTASTHEVGETREASDDDVMCTETPASDDVEPLRPNSGLEDIDAPVGESQQDDQSSLESQYLDQEDSPDPTPSLAGEDKGDTEASKKKKIPPPLPRRRDTQPPRVEVDDNGIGYANSLQGEGEIHEHGKLPARGDEHDTLSDTTSIEARKTIDSAEAVSEAAEKAPHVADLPSSSKNQNEDVEDKVVAIPAPVIDDDVDITHGETGSHPSLPTTPVLEEQSELATKMDDQLNPSAGS